MGDSYLVTNGPIWTGDPVQPWAQAVVVRGTDLVHVGTRDGADALVDASTELIDLHGRMCLPGFIDAHNHLASMAVAKLGVSLSGAVGRDTVLAAVRDWVAAQPGGAALRGHGWMPDSFEDRSPRREWLDEITGDRPMYLFSADAHDMWFNTAAMRAVGIGPQTPDPDPGAQYFVRDADGTPTGHAVEAAAYMPIIVAQGLFSVPNIRLAQQLTLQQAPSWGMTAYFEAGAASGAASADARWIYEDLIAQDHAGTLPVRVAGSYWTRTPNDDPSAITDDLIHWNRDLRSEHVRISTCKMWADGTFMSGGALLLSPCCGHSADDLGAMTFPADHIEAQIEAVQAAGFDMHIHIDADGSARVVLDAYESVRRRRGRENSRHVIAHNSMVDPADLNRYAELGVIANCTPLWGTDYNGQYRDIYTRMLGAERVQERLFPYGDLVRSGAVVTYGSDIPAVDIHEGPPLIQIEALLTRQRPGHPDDVPLVARQRIGLHDALRGYTANGAYQLRLDHRTGTVTTGKAADLTILGADLFRVDPHDIHDVPVVLTMMDGRITHDGR
ncbi:amidohydrolase [Mycolicibacterium anyangense]|uniref:Amidohydrolase n=1 Tax=Mycolicibacterium anyangense TaxID=1431246 RepID=A0A6N4WBQ2_9MYCO|nr:amidohydrolase [Mycolicibacterium anyangense]BBZ77793.1 amidohydrolase [Mycolicibacterium anyangense]